MKSNLWNYFWKVKIITVLFQFRSQSPPVDFALLTVFFSCKVRWPSLHSVWRKKDGLFPVDLWVVTWKCFLWNAWTLCVSMHLYMLKWSPLQFMFLLFLTGFLACRNECFLTWWSWKMLQPLQQPSQHRLCGNHFKTNSSGDGVCGRGAEHVRLQCGGVTGLALYNQPLQLLWNSLLCSIYYYVKLKSAWFPAVRACAEGWVTIVTNIKELAETSFHSSIWGYVTVWCNPVQVSDWWQTRRQRLWLPLLQ